MTRAASVLAAIEQNNPHQLPRYQSKQSGVAFGRLTTKENLEFYRDRAQSLQLRVPDALNYQQSSNQILKQYLSASRQDAVGDSEIVELLGAQLHVSVVLIELVDEFLLTLDESDPTYPNRMAGLRRMKSGMATLVTACVQILTESPAYRSSELKRFIGHMESTLPQILPEVPEGSRSESLRRLRSFLDDPRMQHLKPELDSLVAVAEKSVTDLETP